MHGAPPQDVSSDPYVFFIEGVDGGNALLRVLGTVAVQQARVSALSFECAGGRFQARLDIAGLQGRRAEHLSRRIEQLPLVNCVSFGSRPPP